MTDSKDTREPSMEEILSSIRRIIADEEGDEPPPSQPAAGRDQRPQVVADSDGEDDRAFEDDDDEEVEDVLDLTQRVEEDGEVVDLGARAARPAARHDGDEIEEVEIEPEGPEFRPEPAPAPIAVRARAAPAARPQQPEQEDRPDVATNKPTPRRSLVAETAAGAATSAFARLTEAVAPTTVEHGGADSTGRTVEELVEDLLRPMVKEWLDENLPMLVERLVEREISKIARRAELL